MPYAVASVSLDEERPIRDECPKHPSRFGRLATHSAAQAARMGPRLSGGGTRDRTRVGAAGARLRVAGDRDPANLNVVRLQVIAEFADYFGDEDLSLAALRNQYVDHSDVTLMFIWSPYVKPLRSDARFKQILQDLRLADYYRASGNWGDFCQPVGQVDFSCR